MVSQPRKILVATDLSARCDRAQDRAVFLMEYFNAELLILHVIEPPQLHHSYRRIPFLPIQRYDDIIIERIRRRIINDLSDNMTRVEVLIIKGEKSETIMSVAREEKCDLIIAGIASNNGFDRYTIGKTVEHLLLKSKINLLIVSERMRGPYKKIVVPVDLSNSSKSAIETATTLFPNHAISLLYAYNAPKGSFSGDIDGYIEKMRQVAYRGLTDFISKLDVPDKQRGFFNLIIEHGNEAQVLKDYIQFINADLIVVGSQNRAFFLKKIFGSRTIRLLSNIQCDALVVHDMFV